MRFSLHWSVLEIAVTVKLITPTGCSNFYHILQDILKRLNAKQEAKDFSLISCDRGPSFWVTESNSYQPFVMDHWYDHCWRIQDLDLRWHGGNGSISDQPRRHDRIKKHLQLVLVMSCVRAGRLEEDVECRWRDWVWDLEVWHHTWHAVRVHKLKCWQDFIQIGSCRWQQV